MSERVLGDPGNEYGGEMVWTLVAFMDGSSLRVWWDGGHEVSVSPSGVRIYVPDGVRSHIPWHRIAEIVEKRRDTE